MAESQGRIFPVGGVEIKVDYRSFSGDGGPSVRVYGDVAGRAVQLLRFDCFDNDPHYHYDPEGKDDHRKLDRSSVPDPIAWSLAQLSDQLVPMIRTAGYSDFAAQVDAAAVKAIIPQIATAIRELTPGT